jgi:integrase
MQRSIKGPYSERNGRVWRVIIREGVGKNATRTPYVFGTEAEALEAVTKWTKMLGAKTVAQGMEDFLQYLAEEGRVAGTLATSRIRLTGLLQPVLGLPVKDLSESRCEALYKAYQVGRAPDTHQGALSQAKGMFEHLRKRLKVVSSNPWIDVDPRGRKKRGKTQLNKDGTRKLYAWLCDNLADDRAVAALMALVLGLRAHEVIGARDVDLDDNGTELKIAKSKTRAGLRAVRLPAQLQHALFKRSELRSGRLLPYSRYWVRDAVKWACTQAGCDVVCAQALRGMYATALLDHGVDPDLVARSIGHRSSTTTFGSYAEPGSGRSAAVKKVVGTLEENMPTMRMPFTGLPN